MTNTTNETTITAAEFVSRNEWFSKFKGMERTPLTITHPDGKTFESIGLLAICNRWHINRSITEVIISTLALGTFTAPEGTTITFEKPEGATATRTTCRR